VTEGREALKAYNEARERYGYSKDKGITFVDDAEEARKVSFFDTQKLRYSFAVWI
jgi:hypothetical protein